jgi:hypothetical protein
MIAAVLIVFGLGATGNGQYVINWYTIDGGGDMGNTGGSYVLSGTIGQPDACNRPASMIGGSYEVVGGFWVSPPCTTVPCDFDVDCDVDIDDFNHFVDCVSGPGIYQADSGCQSADFDVDGDVDFADYGLLQRCFSGANIPSDPNCAN